MPTGGGDSGYYLAFSAGKDSQALYHIAELAGVKFEAHMNLTSVDPPEVIRFVKQAYPGESELSGNEKFVSTFSSLLIDPIEEIVKVNNEHYLDANT